MIWWLMLIGLGAAFCTTISFIPQLKKTLRDKQTKDISLGMYIVFVIGVILWLAYGIILTDWPIILANLFTLIFSGTILVMKIKYK